MPSRIKGIITSWNEEKGFGFITPNVGDKQIFIHISAFKNKHAHPQPKKVVTFSFGKDKNGRVCATNATLAGDPLKKHKKTSNNNVSLVLAGLFVLIVIIATFLQKIPFVVLGTYIFASLLSFIVYAVDKKAAKTNKSRIPENTLHLFALLGGWPGATFAQQVLRHKSKKRTFRFVFWLTVLANIVFFAWLQTNSGLKFLEIFLN